MTLVLFLAFWFTFLVGMGFGLWWAWWSRHHDAVVDDFVEEMARYRRRYDDGIEP